MKLSELEPYQSVVITETSQTKTAGEWLEHIRTTLALPAAKDEDDKERPEAAFVHYEVQTDVQWSKDLTETRNVLLAVVLYERLLAIFASEGKQRGRLSTMLRSNDLAGLALVDPLRLQAALVKGAPRLMWLKRIHRQDAWRVDAQLLSARNVATTLDPLAHQSYRYSGVRVSGGKVDSLGVALDDARVWRRKSEDGEDFVDSVTGLLALVDKAKSVNTNPFPVLARARASLSDVKGAVEAVLAPPELEIAAGQPDADDEEAQATEQLALKTVLELSPGPKAEFEADVVFDGGVLGRVKVTPRQMVGRINVKTEVLAESDEQVRTVAKWMRRSGGLTVYYGSGHTLVAGQVAEVRHRDVKLPAASWRWSGFAGVDLAKEKPDGFDLKTTDRAAAITAPGDDSLFGWTYRELRGLLGGDDSKGWLMCDDRPMETCDFIYLDEDAEDGPLLTLVHAKGGDRPSKKNGVQQPVSPNRGTAMHPFELVVSQAVKNLRHLDVVLQGNSLRSFGAYTKAKKGGAAKDPRPVWKDNAGATVYDLTVRMHKLRNELRRRVVIVQPHQRRSRTFTPPSNDKDERLRFQQLHTLLIAARSSCASVGADFVVVGDDT